MVWTITPIRATDSIRRFSAERGTGLIFCSHQLRKLVAVRSLKDHGWDTEHSGTYIDPIEANPRHFDVSAWKEFQSGCSVFMSAESKNVGSNFTVVVSSVLRDNDEAYHDVLWSTPEARGAEAAHVSRMNAEHQPSLLYGVDPVWWTPHG
jgi:hypothetical protein